MTTLHPFLTHLNLSSPQQKAVTARQGDVVVTAGAGTGKTRTLVARYIALLAELPLRQIVAITFTDKAAREMRNRVRQELDRLLDQTELPELERQAWQERLAALDSARISTIHSLCGEILRTHPAEAGLDPRFAVLDEGDTLLLKAQAINWALTAAAQQAPMEPLFTRWKETKLAEILLTLLNQTEKSQTALANLPTEPKAILALWRAHLEQAQTACIQQLLARRDWQENVAFLRRQQASRADDKLEQLRRLVLTAIDAMGATVAEQCVSLHALDGIKLNAGAAKNWPDGKEQVEAVKAALGSLRDVWREAAEIILLEVNQQDHELAAQLPLWSELFAAALGQYQTYKKERLALDFDDLESLALHLLETLPAVRSYWQGQVGALLVDEFQDTNARQLRLIRHLCPEPQKLFIVGDAKQSIYRFRGADVSVFQQERDAIVKAGGTVYDLDQSYRTHQGLLETMNALIRPILGDASPERPAWEAPFAPLQPIRQEPQVGIVAPFLEFHLGIGSKEGGALDHSARMIAERLKELVAYHGLSFDDMVILCRASTSFAAYENALDEAGIPYVTVAGQGFYQRPEIRDLLNALQAVADPSDNLALAGLLRSPLCGLSDVALYELAGACPSWQSWWALLKQDFPFTQPQDQSRTAHAIAMIEQWHAQAGRQTVAELLQTILNQTAYLAGLFQTGQTRAARNVQKLLTNAQLSERIQVEEFLTYLSNVRDSGSREGEARTTADGAVQIMSVHQAKGLEFPLVVLGDAGYKSKSGDDTLLLDEKVGLLLDLADKTQKKPTLPALFELARKHEKALAAAEEKRLLYVAMTRAEQLVLVNGVMDFTAKGKPTLKGWLADMGHALGLTEMAFSEVSNTEAIIHDEQFKLESNLWRLVLYKGNDLQPTQIGNLIASPTQLEELSESFVNPKLPEPLHFAPRVEAEPESDAAQPQRVWQVVPTAQKPTAPAWVIGSLVHAALALWRFPDAGFDAWCLARAREYGLTDASQLRDAVRQTRRLLERFQAHPLYAEMNQAARRLAEVPYMLEQEGQTERGIIDALYQNNEQWTVVDYKIDELSDAAALSRLLDEKDYREQLGRYAVAIERLVGTRPLLLLCFLDVIQEIRLVPL